MLMSILEQYVQVLWNCFQYDIGVFSNVWMYIPLMMPVTGYTIFFVIKWSILTAPIWIPLSSIFKGPTKIVESVTNKVTKK